MTDQFTFLEIQLIRSSLTTKTDEEIAELLEKDINDVRYQINEMTGGGAEERNTRIKDVKAIILREQTEKMEARRNKEANRLKRLKESNERHSVKKEREEKEQRQRNSIEQQMYEHKRQRTAYEERKTYKTRQVDYSKMKSVRVNKNTIVWVDKSVSDADAIKQYEKNRISADTAHIKPAK